MADENLEAGGFGPLATFPFERHPYMKHIDLVDEDTNQYLGPLLVPFEGKRFCFSVYDEDGGFAEAGVLDSVFGCTVTLNLDFRCFDDHEYGAVFVCHRGGMKVDRGIFEEMVKQGLALHYTPDTVREEKYLWRKDLLDRQRKAA